MVKYFLLYFYLILIISSILGYGFLLAQFLNKNLLKYNLGYIGILGLLALVILSYTTIFFIKHGIQKTLKMMNIYTFLMIISTNLLFVFGFAGMIFFVTSNILNIYFAFQLIKLNKSKNLKKDSIKLFGFSIIYLFLIFLLTVIDRFF